jgi:hypothetical protein
MSNVGGGTVYAITSIPTYSPATNNLLRLAARIKTDTLGAQYRWQVMKWPDRVEIGYSYNGDTGNHWVDDVNILIGQLAYPDANWHVYESEIQFPASNPGGHISGWKDGASIGSSSYPPIAGNTYTPAALSGVLNPTGNIYIDWLALSYPAAFQCSLAIGSQSLFNNDAVSDYGSALPTANGFYDETNGWQPVTVTGSQTVTVKVMNNSAYTQAWPGHVYFDDIAIMADKTVKITGLLGGQKIELYNSGGTLLYSATCPITGATVTLVTDITSNITTAYGLSGYFKVYDTNGTTLLYTSSTMGVWGGDVYNWLPNNSNLIITANPTLVYVSGLSPTTSAIQVTLTDATSSMALSGRTVSFVSNLGTCNPTSASTDGNGKASTTFTAGTSAGLGGVRASFAGDSTYGAAAAQQLIDIYLKQPVINSSAGFQVFIEGQEIVVASGDYRLSTVFQPQSFQIVTPVMTYALGGWWLVQIYRFGILEFSGRIMARKRQSGPNPQTTISGVDIKVLLQRRIVNTGYTDDPKNIITSLLNTYPCGISPGTIALYGNTLTLAATYEVLQDALAQIQSATGWRFRLNAAGTLDFGSSFGAVQNVNVVLGVNAIMTDNEEDWSQLSTSVTAVVSGSGSSLLVSQVSDPTSTLTYGLIEMVSLQKSATTQGALNLVAHQLLNNLDQSRVTIMVDYADQRPTGTYGPWDTISVTDTTTSLSGQYQVFNMKRDLTNANYAQLGLTRLPIGITDIMQLLRATVKDLSL